MSVFYGGGGEQKSIYYGNKKIDKIYKGNTLVYSSGPSLVIGVPTRFDYTGKPQTVKVDKFKKLQIDAVGGCGGSGEDADGLRAFGGRVQCTLDVSTINTVYLYVGGAGKDGSSAGVVAGGWNGGGDGYTEDDTHRGSGGGGATDIRTVYNADPLNPDSLKSRLVVAGAGGGSGIVLGGNGGGLEANDGECNWSVEGSFGTGGTQSKGGVMEAFGDPSAPYSTGAGLGQGGYKKPYGGYTQGGGSGYYGGGSANGWGGGGGGSSYADSKLCASVVHTKAYYDAPSSYIVSRTIKIGWREEIFTWKGVDLNNLPPGFTGHGYIIITPLS